MHENRVEPKKETPTGVKILSIFSIIGSFGGLGSALFFLNVVALWGRYLGWIGGAYTVLGIYGLFTAIIDLALAYGLWTGKGWAWTTQIILILLGFIMSFINMWIFASIPGFIVTIFLSIIYSLVFGAVILYYLYRPHVKAFFGKGQTISLSVIPLAAVSLKISSPPLIIPKENIAVEYSETLRLMDSLNRRLAEGAISEEIFRKLNAEFQTKLDKMRQSVESEINDLRLEISKFEVEKSSKLKELEELKARYIIGQITLVEFDRRKLFLDNEIQKNNKEIMFRQEKLRKFEKLK